MKLAAAALAVLALVGAEPASAYKFSPENTRFRFVGFFAFKVDGKVTECRAHLAGKTDRHGNAQIVSFDGGPNCHMTPMGLPWTLKPIAATKAAADGFGYMIKGNLCGPTRLAAYIAGRWEFRSSSQGTTGPCWFYALEPVTPNIVIVP